MPQLRRTANMLHRFIGIGILSAAESKAKYFGHHGVVDNSEKSERGAPRAYIAEIEKKKLSNDKIRRIYIRRSLSCDEYIECVCKDNRYHNMVFMASLYSENQRGSIQIMQQTLLVYASFRSQIFPSNMLKFRHTHTHMQREQNPTHWSNDVQSKYSSFSHLYCFFLLSFFSPSTRYTWHFCSSFALLFFLSLFL